MASEAQIQEQINQALEAERNSRIAAVSVKLPQFWPDKTRFWFAQAEAQFETKGITVEKTKFSHVVQMLDSKTATQALDIIETPDPTEPYTVLKNQLTKAFSLSDSEKASRIIDMNGLGDRTPSQCLADMLQLVPQAHAADPGFLFREHFLRQLPPDIRTQLAQTTKIGTTAKILRELAEEADRYFSSTGARISSITAPSAFIESSPSLNPESSNEAEIFAISNRGGSGPQGSGSRGQGGARQGPRPPTTYRLCFYHNQFGEKAKKCEQPCDFKTLPGNSQPGRRQAN